eukprot:TRINITY_DN1958_c0_g1_i1.p1 TRINITY_DN1958_c0_g1~~TRINITY_DN1958_c0_g1_i1.p1  ORF type:complete len:328 (+),score=96.78 TRINITY_DN1958_c0_g1_i1:75-1058(+)
MELINKKKIGTHSGSFHVDECLACYMLKKLPSFSEHEIIRSRDPKVLDECDVLVDVGGVYDHEKKRYDHHQREFKGTLGENYKTRLSSAGLIYKHYGADFIQHKYPNLNPLTVNLIYTKLYLGFVEGIDAIDNGINQYDTEIQPNYQEHTNLSSRVGKLNPGWREKNPDHLGGFNKAMEMAGREFEQSLDSLVLDWLPARDIVLSSINEREKVDESGEIVILKEFCPWESHLFNIEQELNIQGKIKYILFEDTISEAKSWRVRAVSLTQGKFELRRALPESWRGLRDEQLSQKAGIPDLVFVHANGFIGGAKTFEGALKMSQLSLKL